MKILLISFVLIPISLVLGQSQEQEATRPWSSMINSERFQNSVVVKVNNQRKDWRILKNIEATILVEEESFFNQDSIHWNYSDMSSNRYRISIPNDITLIYGKDRKELQDQLDSVLKTTKYLNETEGSSVFTAVLITIRQGSETRYGQLSEYSFLMDSTNKLVCDIDQPFYSLINSFIDTCDCNGLYSLDISNHLYGNRTDSLKLDLNSLIVGLNAKTWKKWMMFNDESLLVLLQHPLYGFDHVLFFSLKQSTINPLWKVDLHTYVPNHNLTDLFGSYLNSEQQEVIEID